MDISKYLALKHDGSMQKVYLCQFLDYHYVKLYSTYSATTDYCNPVKWLNTYNGCVTVSYSCLPFD